MHTGDTWKSLYEDLFKPAHDLDRLMPIPNFEAFMSRPVFSSDLNDARGEHQQMEFMHCSATGGRDIADAVREYDRTLMPSALDQDLLKSITACPLFGAFEDMESPKNAIWRFRFVHSCKLSWRRACLERLRLRCRNDYCRMFSKSGCSRLCSACAKAERDAEAKRAAIEAENTKILRLAYEAMLHAEPVSCTSMNNADEERF